MTASLELIKYGIRVNSLSPGGVWTPMLQRACDSTSNPEKTKKDLQERYPIGRFATPNEIARSALFLVSEDSRYCTGMNLIVDGGVLAKIF
jgi:NAD(P)-dependent dehydrogenase (short-subunit alcohol dehydrogenase family)